MDVKEGAMVSVTSGCKTETLASEVWIRQHKGVCSGN